MDPFTLLQLGGTAVNVIGRLMGSSSAEEGSRIQADAFRTQAQIGDLNAELLGKQADVAAMGVDFAAGKERIALGKIAESGRQTLASQRSYFAGGNTDPTFGSPLLVQAITAGRVATDMEITKANFAIDKANALSTEASLRGQAAGAAGKAQNARLSASLADMKGDSDSMAGYFGAATALLSGASGLFKGFGGFGGSTGGGSSGGGFSLQTTGGLY